jgi:hypothetical protein
VVCCRRRRPRCRCMHLVGWRVSPFWSPPMRCVVSYLQLTNVHPRTVPMARTHLLAGSGVLPMHLSLAVALGAVARGAAFGRLPCSVGVASNVPSLHSRFPMLDLLFPSLPSRMDARDAPRAIRAAHLSMRSRGSDSAGHRTFITHILASHARVFVISDLHADYKPNMAWIKSLPSRRAEADAAAGCLSVLLIAGDLASDLDTLEEGLLALKGKFDEVA